ncbi:hypothetical protein [Salinibacter ruber]|uniref:hypothetical protein n=1 Tax=Salinibacter ruber TaxID=146919 RepID=UPI000E592E14|nr:hypothetical protein [Salinibacter ruber]
MDNGQIYHAKKGADLSKAYTPHETRRPPSNVSYLVDNLWEWARPEGYPSRRNAKFGNPDPKEALRSAHLSSPDQVYRVEFLDDPKVAQMTTDRDARDHSDCRSLRKLVVRTLDGDMGRYSWVSQDLSEKGPAAQLFQPCLTKEEVNRIFEKSDALRPHREEIREAVEFWDDVVVVEPGDLDNDEGEVFFEYEGGFRLHPLE